MDKLGELIRNTLKAKNMTSIDLGNITDLNPRTIDNIIHGKSRKAELLRRISNVLGIDLIKFESATEALPEPDDIDIDVYNRASCIVAQQIKLENLYINKSILDSLTLLAYKILLDNHNISEMELCYFVKGMIKFGLHHFILNYKI
jgi:transcriptional regulator with XRE-family HTH domain